MSEYIERDDVLAAIEHAAYWRHSFNAIYDAVQDIPAEDVAPVVHSSWEIKTINISHFKGDYRYYYLQCQICGHKEEIGCPKIETLEEFEALIGRFPYCHCGAKMDGGDDHG